MKLILIIIISSALISCGDEKKKNNNFKKQTNIPMTGQSIDKKSKPANKVSDFY